MNRQPPSFTMTTIVLLAIIIFTVLAGALAAALVKDFVAVALVLLYSVTIFLIVIPYFALVTDRVSSNTWLITYIQILGRLPIIRAFVPSPNQILKQKAASDFAVIIDRRIQARDWKYLHLTVQEINFKVVVIQGTVQRNRITILQDLVDLWQLDCSGILTQFIRLVGLAEGTVREEFASLDFCQEWLSQLKLAADELDRSVAECKKSEEILDRFSEIQQAVSYLVRITGQLLVFLDKRLKKTIDELEKEIETARESLMML